MLAEQSCRLINRTGMTGVSLLSIAHGNGKNPFLNWGDGFSHSDFKRNNPCGINNANLIGNAPLSVQGYGERAIPICSKALLDCMVHQVTLVNGYLNVLAAQQDWQSSRPGSMAA